MIADKVKEHFEKIDFKANRQEIRNAVYSVMELLYDNYTVEEILNYLYPEEDYGKHS